MAALGSCWRPASCARHVLILGERYYGVELCDRVADAQPMTGARYSNIFQHLIVELPDQIELYVVRLEGVGILRKPDAV